MVVPAPAVTAHTAKLALLAALLLSCSGDGPTSPAPTPVVAAVAVTPGIDTVVTVGRTRQFAAQARDASGAAIVGVSIAWSSADTTIATVSSTGLVTAKASGVVSITATVGSVSGSGLMAVVQFVSAVTVTPGNAAASSVGDTSLFAAVARDSSGAVVPGVRFLWSSSNTGVAVVDTLGRAIATGSGVATISATGRGTPGYAALAVTQAATQLVFTAQPTDAVAGAAIDPGIEVEVRDARGAVLEDYRGSITIALEDSAAGATLAGTRTVNAVAGVARFSGIWVNRAKRGYTLRASADGIPGVESAAFSITAGPVARMAATVSDSVLETEVAGSASLRVEYFDAYDNPTAPVETSLSMASVSRPNAVVRHTGAVTDSVSRLYNGLHVSRAGRDLRIEVTAGNVRGISNTFISKTSFTAVAAGGSHACGLAPAGTFCWGSNSHGQLGQGLGATSLPSDTVPILVVGGHLFSQIDASGDQTCGLAPDGAAYCWGDSPLGPQLAPQLVPTTGPGGLVFESVQVGNLHACGLTSTDDLYCWGDNSRNQLVQWSNDPPGYSETPLSVKSVDPSQNGYVTVDMKFSQFAVGAAHTCGNATSALFPTSLAYCWGDNASGQSGNGGATMYPVPDFFANFFGDFAQFAGGGAHSCAVEHPPTGGGGVRCWGLNTSLQLGAAASVVSSIEPVAPVPNLYLYGTMIRRIEAGGASTCVLPDPRIFGADNGRCWGANEYGQLGDGTYSTRGQGSSILLPSRPTQISVGGTLTCALTANGVYCWGRNVTGELGIGTTTVASSSIPLRIIQ